MIAESIIRILIVISAIKKLCINLHDNIPVHITGYVFAICLKTILPD